MQSIRQKIGLYGIFLAIFFWDILDTVIPNLPFAFIILLLLLCTNIQEIKLNRNFLLVILFIVSQGLINILLGNDTGRLLLTQIVAVSICFIAYDNLIAPFSPAEIMSVYWKAAFWMAVIGICEAALSLLKTPAVTKLPVFFTYTAYEGVVGPLPRLASLCREPSFLGYFLAPAVCLFLGKKIVPELTDNSLKVLDNNFEGIIIFAAYIMTFSSVAYFGLAIMLIILWWEKGFSIKKIIIPLVVIVLYMVAYNNIDDFRTRVNDTWNLFNGVSQTASVNFSSFTYYSNWRVAYNSFLHTKGFGAGLGSYQNMFDKFNIGSWGTSGIESVNREDGNSAFFRILTELGVVGLLAVMYFLIKEFRRPKDKYTIYSCAILSLFTMFLLRQGNYTHAGSILFVCLYLKVAKMPQVKTSEKLKL